VIRYRGRYRYASQQAAERAVSAARSVLEDEDITDTSLASLRSLVSRGTSLDVDIRVSESQDVRVAAANLFEALASPAVAGVVEACDSSTALDVFPSGGDD
jgi:hypothetical protein